MLNTHGWKMALESNPINPEEPIQDIASAVPMKDWQKPTEVKGKFF